MTTFSFPLSIPEATTTASGSAAAASSGKAGGEADAFLGYGLITPFQRDGKTDFASAGGARLLRSVVGQILGMRAWGPGIQGELPWRQDLGSQLERVRYKKGIVLQELSRVYVQDALEKHDPRIRVSRTVLEFNQETRVQTIRVFFDLINVNAPGNQVLLKDAEVTAAL